MEDIVNFMHLRILALEAENARLIDVIQKANDLFREMLDEANEIEVNNPIILN